MSRCTSAHENPQGPGDSRPTALQIVEDEGLVAKLNGKVFVITGTSSGIGVETARALSATGATLFLTARNLAKAQSALTGVLEPGRVELVEMDNTSFDSVRTAAAVILQRTNSKVNVLINNAGVMAIPDLQFTADGHEMQFGVNHLSHFLLFQFLKSTLLKSSTPDFHSRVVNVASSGHQIQTINDSDNYNFQEGRYTPLGSYGQSKTANIYMANELDRRYGSRGLHATSIHPGWIFTGLQVHVDPAEHNTVRENQALARVLKSTEQGAATTVVAAIGRDWKDRGGRFLADCKEAKPKEDGDELGGPWYASHCYDPEREARLWKDSLVLVGREDDD